MVSNERAAVVRAMTEAIDRHDLAALSAHPGLYELVEHIPTLLAAFPDLAHTVEEQIVDGEVVTTRAVMRGTHRGPFMGVAPTGRRIESMVLMMDTVVGGKIVLHYALPDWMAVLIPIGALPAFGPDPAADGPAQARKEEAMDAEAAALRELVAAVFEGAWNRHDAQAFAAGFAEDADFTNIVGMQAQGRAAIASFHAPLFATLFKESRMAVTAVRARLIKPDVAAADVHWEMAGGRDPEGNPLPPRTGLANLIATKGADGRWAIAVLHNMELAGAPPVTAAQVASVQRELRGDVQGGAGG